MAHPEVSTGLWFDGPVEKIAAFYCSLFDDATVTSIFCPHSNGAAPALTVTLMVQGQRLLLLNVPPRFIATATQLTLLFG